MRVILFALLVACGAPSPRHRLVLVDAGVDAPLIFPDASYGSCNAPPTLPACTCGDWICLDASGHREILNLCGPPCDAPSDR